MSAPECIGCGMWHPSVFLNVPVGALINWRMLTEPWVCIGCKSKNSLHHRGSGRDRAPVHRYEHRYKAPIDMGMDDEDDDE